MRKKMIVEKLEMISNAIDGLSHNQYPAYDDAEREVNQIQIFIFDIMDEKKIFKNLLGEKFEREDEYTEFITLFCKVSFGLGFAVGQLFETPYKPIKDDIKILGKLLKEKKLLPYFPREKERRTT